MKWVMLFAMTLAAMGQDTPANFGATARIQLLTQLHNGTNPNGAEIGTTAQSVDLTKEPPVMLNRWAIRLPFITLEPWEGWAQVTGMCDGQGRVIMLVAGWGMVELTPSDRTVWAAMNGRMSFETRLQHVIITAHQIIAEEPIRTRAMD